MTLNLVGRGFSEELDAALHELAGLSVRPPRRNPV